MSHPAWSPKDGTKDTKQPELHSRRSCDETMKRHGRNASTQRNTSEELNLEERRSRSSVSSSLKREEEDSNDAGNFGSDDGDYNNNAPPAEYWRSKQPLADQIVITEVTVDLMTVTIRECTTQEGFFHPSDTSNPSSKCTEKDDADSAVSQAAAALMEMSSSKGHTNTNTVAQH